MYFELGFKKNPYINTYLFFWFKLWYVFTENSSKKSQPSYIPNCPFSFWYVFQAIFLSKPPQKYIPFCYFTVWYVLTTFF